ncbi:MAG TPA: hypothetical protein VMU20_19760 [Candidatus Dormibacteraeota bacterium]|jgi:hypothetical protein|nr:hypothetical protein [Candidatus Dormibacteraeota bacterium]
MTKRTRASRQQAARRRPQPRPTTPGGGPPRPPGGSGGGPDGPAGVGAPVEPDDDTLNGATEVAGDEEAPAPAAAAPVARPAQPGGARRVGRIDPATAARRLKPQQKQQQSFAPLDPEDPAIPFDRVPYVPGDLRRVAIMAGMMIVLIVLAAIVVTHTVGS